MQKLIKNLEHSASLPLAEQVSYKEGKVASLTLAQRPGVGLTLFAFDVGEGLNTHAASGDAMAYILEGQAQITIDGVLYEVGAGGAIIMPIGIPHAVKAITRVKMLLIVVKEA